MDYTRTVLHNGCFRVHTFSTGQCHLQVDSWNFTEPPRILPYTIRLGDKTQGISPFHHMYLHTQKLLILETQMYANRLAQSGKKSSDLLNSTAYRIEVEMGQLAESIAWLFLVMSLYPDTGTPVLVWTSWSLDKMQQGRERTTAVRSSEELNLSIFTVSNLVYMPLPTMTNRFAYALIKQ